MQRRVISNASPLITLAKANLLDLLPGLFGEVLVPRAVVEEILQGPDYDPMRRMISNLKWLKHISLEPSLPPLGYWQLGRGESEVIEYARRNAGTLSLLDDKDARGVAAALQIPAIGTLGIVAKSVRGSVDSFDQMIKPLQEAGLYVDEAAISTVRKGLSELLS